MSKKPFDYRSGTRKDAKGKVLRSPKDNSTEIDNYRWWDAEEKDMAGAIRATVNRIQQQQVGRMEQLVMSTRLYGSTASYNLFGGAFSKSTGSSANPTNQRISYNLCSSVVDTLESKIAKNKVIPTYITNGAIWDNQKKAEQLTKFAQGMFYEEQIHEKAVESFSDGAVWGDGFVYVYNNNGKVGVERVLPHELLVDDVESTVTNPTQMHRVRIMDRDIAAETFQDLKEEIGMVAPINYQEMAGKGSAADLIMVTESWHLKSSEDSDDGMRVISIGDGVMIDDWDRDYFPFPHFRYVKRKLGWYGQGACERLQNIQGEINRGMILKQRSLWMMGSFKVLLENGSKIVKQHLDNEVGTIITYTSTPPQYVTPPATNPELQAWIDSLIQKGMMQEGISDMQATGQAPMGVDSGKAMRTLDQIGDDRHLFRGQMMEQFCLEIARQAIDVVKEIYEEKGEYKVIFQDTNFLETVDWKDIDPDMDQYWLKAYPTSSLSDDITGRLSEVQEMMQAGLITPRLGKKLMQMPDLEMADSLENATYDLCCMLIEDMLFDGKAHQPEEFYDLGLAKELSLKYYNYGKLHRCPDKRLGLVRDFLTQVDDILGINAPPPPPGMPMAPEGALPMANPTATPTSNLIPNVPQGGQ